MAARRLLWRLSRHPRIFRWWYFRALPALIHRRALLRRWCSHTRLGRLLCGPLPAPVLLAAQYAAAVLVAAASLAAVHLAELIYCGPQPAAGKPPCHEHIARACRPPRGRSDD